MKKILRLMCRKTPEKHRTFARLSARAGYTMVEMVISFALLGIFMVAACQIMASCARLYNQVKGMSYGRQVADIVLDKVAGEIEDATHAPDERSGQNGFFPLVIYKDVAGEYDKIDFYDRTGGHVFLTATTAYAGNAYTWRRTADRISESYGTRKAQLFLHFYAVETRVSENDEQNKKVTFEATNWLFDESMYMGYSIKRLNFTLCPEERTEATGTTVRYPENVIRIDLVIESPRYGEYTARRYVSCIAFEETGLGEMKETWWTDSPDVYGETNAVVVNDYWPATLEKYGGCLQESGGIFSYDGYHYVVMEGGARLTAEQLSGGPETLLSAGYVVKLTGTVYTNTLNDATELKCGDVFFDENLKKTYVCRYTGYNLPPNDYPAGWKLIAE